MGNVSFAQSGCSSSATAVAAEFDDQTPSGISVSNFAVNTETPAGMIDPDLYQVEWPIEPAGGYSDFTNPLGSVQSDSLFCVTAGGAANEGPDIVITLTQVPPSCAVSTVNFTVCRVGDFNGTNEVVWIVNKELMDVDPTDSDHILACIPGTGGGECQGYDQINCATVAVSGTNVAPYIGDGTFELALITAGGDPGSNSGSHTDANCADPGESGNCFRLVDFSFTIIDRVGDDCTNVNGAPGNLNDQCVCIAEPGELDLVKSLTDVQPAASGIEGNMDASYEFEICNIGVSDVTNIGLEDDFEDQFEAAFIDVIIEPAVTCSLADCPTAIAMNGYTGGGANIQMLNEDGTLEAGDCITVTVTVELDLSEMGISAENQALTTGTDTSTDEEIDDESDNDSPSDPNDPDSDDDDPTPFPETPSISATKTFVSAVPQTDGDMRVSFDFVVENNGNTDLENLSLQDDLSGMFATPLTQDIQISVTGGTASDLPPDNMGVYTGMGVPGQGGTIDLLEGVFGLLEPNEFYTLSLSFDIDPIAFAMIFPEPENQAIASGFDINDVTGDPVTDLTDDPLDMMNDDPNVDNSPDDPTSIVLPGVIDVTKSLTGTIPATSGVNGNVDATYSFDICNTGGSDVNDIGLTDDFSTEFGTGFVEVVIDPIVTCVLLDCPTAVGTGVFSGSGAFTQMLNEDGVLEPGDCISIEVAVELDLSEMPEPATNQATATGTDVSTGGAVADDSDNDNPMDPDDPNSDDDDPTPFPEIPSITATKSFVDVVSQADGDVRVTFDFDVENNGNTDLENLSLQDDISAFFASPISQNIDIQVTGGSATNLPTENMGTYTGMGASGNGGSIDLLLGNDGLLEPGQNYTLTLSFDIDPIAFAMIMTQPENQAISSGNDPNDVTDTPVTDPTDDPIDMMDDDPNMDNDPDDPTGILIPGELALTKTLEDITSDMNEIGHVLALYSFEVCNIGGSDVFDINISDDFTNEFGSGFLGVDVLPNMLAIGANDTGAELINLGNVSSDFMGANPMTNLLDGTADLGPGRCLSVEVTVELDLDLMPMPAMNQATATGTDSNLNDLSDLSDDQTDLDADGMDDGEMGTNDDPTPFPAVPQINVAKAVGGYLDDAIDPTVFTINYRQVIKNTGNTILENIQLTDDLDAVFCGGVTGTSVGFPVVISSTAQSAPIVNGGFNGGAGVADIDIFDGVSGVLNPGEEVVVDIEVIIDLDDIMVGCTNPFLNTSNAEGTPTDGMGNILVDPFTGDPYMSGDVVDISDSGTVPDSNNPGAPNDSGGPDDPTPVYLPAGIGLVKSITFVEPASTDGNYLVTLQYTIQNTGGSNIENIDLFDDIDAQWGSAFVDVETMPSIINTNIAIMANVPTPNMNYDGVGDTNLLSSDGQLDTGGGGEFVVVEVIVEVDISEAPATGLMNQATTSGIDVNPIAGSTGEVSDLSDDNTSSTDPDDPYGDNPNGAGDDGTDDMNNATPLQIAEIKTTKAVVGTPVNAMSGVPGNFDVTFELEIENTGTTDLINIGLEDDLQSQFGSAFEDVVSAPMIVSSTADSDPSFEMAPVFDGDAQIEFFDLMSGLLKPGQSIVIQFTIELVASDIEVSNATNQTTASGDPVDELGNPIPDPNNPGSNLGMVTDLSDDGTGLPANGDPNTDNTGAEGDMGTSDDPTPINFPSSLELKKMIVDFPMPAASGVLGNYDATYQFELCNNGGTTLFDVELKDDFSTQYGSAFILDIVSDPEVISSMGNTTLAYPAPNLSFAGLTPIDGLIIPSNITGLQPGACIVVEVIVEVDISELASPMAANQADASGMSPGGEIVTDLSDDTTDLDNDGEDGDNDTGGTDDPTLFPVIPEISVTKELTMSEVLINGDVKLTFSFIVENTGNTILNNLSLEDPLSFLPAADPIDQLFMIQVDNISADMEPSASPVFDGVTFVDMLIGTNGSINPGEQYMVTMMVEVDPTVIAGMMQPVTNQAEAFGSPVDDLGMPFIDPTDPMGGSLGEVSDTSDDGDDPSTDNPSAPGDMGTTDDPTPIVVPPVPNVTKELIAVPVAQIDGTYNLTYEVVAQNQGGLPLENISLVDDLMSQFGCSFNSASIIPGTYSFTGSTVASMDPGENMSFNGADMSNMINMGGVLDSFDEIVLEISVNVDVSCSTMPLPLENTVELSGDYTDPFTGDSIDLDDDSDDATDLDGNAGPDNDDPDDLSDPNDSESNPTLVYIPEIEATKALISSNILPNGNGELVFELNVVNTGNTTLTNISLEDDMVEYSSTILNIPVVSLVADNSTSNDIAVNSGGYDPGTDSDLIISPNTVMLNPTEDYTIQITLEVDPIAFGLLTFPVENIATATGEALDENGDPLTDINGDQIVVEDLSDDVNDGEDINPDMDGDPDDPTPIYLPPAVSLAKTISGTPILDQQTGFYVVPYTLTAQNIGGTYLTNLSIIDDIAMQFDCAFIGVSPLPVISVAGTLVNGNVLPTPNLLFDGDAASDAEMLNLDGDIAPGEIFTVDFSILVDPDCPTTPSPLENQATITGTAADANGDPVPDPNNPGDNFGDATDDSDSGTDTDPNVDTNTNDPELDDVANGSPNTTDDPTELYIPAIGVSKELIGTAYSPIQGNFIFTYELSVQNTGNTPLEDVELDDDIASQFGASFVSANLVDMSLNSPTGVSNLGGMNIGIPFDGTGTDAYSEIDGSDLLDGTANMEPGEIISLQIEVEVDATFVPEEGLDNSATAYGTSIGPDGSELLDINGDPIIVEDLSEDGGDPDGADEDGEDNDNEDPTDPDFDGFEADTPTQIPPLPSIALTKDIVGFSEAASGAIGNVDVTFQLTVFNAGNVDLSELSVTDDIETQFGSPFVSVIGDPIIVGGSSDATMDSNVNNDFDGTSTEPDMLDGGGLLEPGQSFIIEIVVELDPNADGAPDPLENQAVAVATPFDMDGNPVLNPVTGLPSVTDDSDSGTDPEGVNVGEPGDDPDNMPYDNPTEIRVPQISTVKSLVEYLPPFSGLSGHLDVVMEIGVKNIGNVTLDDVSIIDDLTQPLPDGFDFLFGGIVDDGTYPEIVFSSEGTPSGLNPDFDGGILDAELLDMMGVMESNQEMRVRIRIEIDATGVDLPDTLWNSALASGTYTDPNDGSITQVDDLSDSGAMHESTNPGQPGDLGTPDDPTPIPLLGCIGDRVWFDCNGNGLQDPGEEGIEDVFVLLYTADGTLVDLDKTDDDGLYLIDFILPGDYYLEFQLPDDYEFTEGDVGMDDDLDSDVTGMNGEGTTDTFTIVAGTQCEDNDFWDAGMFKCMPIGDMVWYDSDEDDVFDPMENGINGLEVNLYRMNGMGVYELYDTQNTQHEPGSPSNDGWYKFCAPPGTYYIEVGDPLNGLVLAQPNVGSDEELDSDLDNFFGPNTSDAFEVGCEEGVCDLGAGFYLMATAGDIVWRDSNGDGVHQSYEPKMADVKIEAFDNTGTKISESFTNGNGEYFIDYLQQEDYYFKVTPPIGFSPTSSNIGNDQNDSDVDGSNGQNTTDFFSMTSGSHEGHIDVGLILGVVPVEFSSFWGLHREDHNYIEWTTASEVSNSHFELERSFNNGGFEKISRIEGNGTTTAKQSYNFNDNDIAESGVYYYRLQQVDYNGAFDYSGTIAINVTRRSISDQVEVYPNPFADDLTIDVETIEINSIVEMEIYDIQGKLVVKQILDSNKQIGKDQYTINLESLQSGKYTIKILINGEEYDTQVLKLVD